MTFAVSIFLYTATSSGCSMCVVFGGRLRRMTSFFPWLIEATADWGGKMLHPVSKQIRTSWQSLAAWGRKHFWNYILYLKYMPWFIKSRGIHGIDCVVFTVRSAMQASSKDGHGGNRTTGSFSAIVHIYMFICGNCYEVCVFLSNRKNNLLGRLIEVERSLVTVVYLLRFVKESVVIKRFP